MTARKFLAEIVSTYTTILVTGTNQPLAAEVASLLRQKPHLQVTEIHDANTQRLPDEDINVIVHFAGFEKPSLAETLYHTSTLHRLMDFSLQSHAKFIMVFPEKNSPEQQTAVSLIKQFGKNFSLNFAILTIPLDVEKRLAAVEIIKSFIHNFSAPLPPKEIHPVQVLENHPAQITFDQRPKTNTKRKWHKVFSVLLGLFLIIFLQLGIILGSLGCSYQFLVRHKWGLAKHCASVADIVSRGLIGQARLVGQGNFFIAINRSASVMFNLAKVGDLVLARQFSQVAVSLPLVSEQLAYLDSEIAHTKILNKWRPRIQETRNLISKAQLFLPVAAQAAESPKQVWLILLQDNKELRPTGGFLSNFALVYLESGEVTDVQFYNTEQADGMLHGQVEPPADLKFATRQGSWYLRDANWDPSFVESAKRSAWFVDKELGVAVDGVVGINTKLAQSFATILNTSGEGFTVDLLTKIRSATPNQQQALGREVLSGMQTREVMFYSTTDNTGILASGWGGGVTVRTCDGQSSCLDDVVYVVDSNVGVNKVNPKIKLDYKLQAKMSPKQIDYQYTLHYTNTSTSQSWPEGDYVDYVRFVLHNDVVVDKITVNGVSQAEPGDSGFLLSVPVGQSKEVKVIAHRGITAVPRQYSLTWLNQPGQSAVPIEINFGYAPEMTFASRVTPNIASVGNFGYNAVLTKPYSLSWTAK